MFLPILPLLLLLLLSFPILSSTSTLPPYAALGDSYATGAGSGHAILWPPSSLKCGRFTSSYPQQIVAANLGTVFRDLTCGGSSTTTVLLSQVPWIEDSEVATLTIGGNEADFFKVVNDCIFGWVGLGGCRAAIDRSRDIIASESFRGNLERLIRKIVGDMVPRGRLLVTGYARFFNDTTTQCDGVSFSRGYSENTLTRGRRVELNDLVEGLNTVIEKVTLGNGAEYVDIDMVFRGHRFCEEGSIEPDVDRGETWFLTLGSPVMSRERFGVEISRFKNAQAVIRDGVPEFAVFHPTILGQTAIAEAIMQQLKH